MKRTIIMLTAATCMYASLAAAEVNLNVNLGIPAARVVAAGPPALVFESDPLFLSPGRLGFYIGVGTPYDIVFSGSAYYLFHDNHWYRSPHYRGPWTGIEHRQLPPGIRKHRIDQIRSYRDREYREYQGRPDNYRGRHFRGDHDRKEHMKDERRREHREMKEEQRERKEDRREMREEHRRGRD